MIAHGAARHYAALIFCIFIFQLLSSSALSCHFFRAICHFQRPIDVFYLPSFHSLLRHYSSSPLLHFIGAIIVWRHYATIFMAVHISSLSIVDITDTPSDAAATPLSVARAMLVSLTPSFHFIF
jgi:hypothetical protein